MARTCRASFSETGWKIHHLSEFIHRDTQKTNMESETYPNLETPSDLQTIDFFWCFSARISSSLRLSLVPAPASSLECVGAQRWVPVVFSLVWWHAQTPRWWFHNGSFRGIFLCLERSKSAEVWCLFPCQVILKEDSGLRIIPICPGQLPPKKLTKVPQKGIIYIEDMNHLPTINFQGYYVFFRGCSWVPLWFSSISGSIGSSFRAPWHAGVILAYLSGLASRGSRFDLKIPDAQWPIYLHLGSFEGKCR